MRERENRENKREAIKMDFYNSYEESIFDIQHICLLSHKDTQAEGENKVHQETNLIFVVRQQEIKLSFSTQQERERGQRREGITSGKMPKNELRYLPDWLLKLDSVT